MTFAFAQVAAAAEAPPVNIPEAVARTVEGEQFKAEFAVGVWINPFCLRGDFDGDGRVDYAVLVSRRSDNKKGIAIWLSSKRNFGPIILGAGRKSEAGASESDNWNFFDAWQVYGKRRVGQGVGDGVPPKLIGEAMLIEKSEAASGIIYWDGKRFRWYQQGD